jgi:hypothetical protein
MRLPPLQQGDDDRREHGMAIILIALILAVLLIWFITAGAG